MKNKPIKLFNGRHFNDSRSSENLHLYIGAHSLRHAARLYCEARYKALGINRPYDDSDVNRASHEIKEYFHQGCWGISMKDVQPEIGIWESVGWGEKAAIKRLI